MIDKRGKTENLTPPRKRMFYWLFQIGVLCGVLYGVVLSALLIFENQMVFPGAGPSRGNWKPTGFEFEEVSYRAEDGTKLVSWYLRQQDSFPNDRQRKPTVLVFHGNAENVATSAVRVGVPLRNCLQADVMLAEYRGYGKSEGSATEPGILQDAEAAMKWLCERTGKSPSEIIVVGHSIGGGPACYLAGKTGCQALVLDRTFDSLVSTAQRVYPIFPIKLLMKNTMRSDQWIQNYQGPLFILHGNSDTLIPHQSAQRLFELAPSKNKKLLILEDWGHWDSFPEDYWLHVEDFLDEN
jgi:fermentation-respiration switch protein FrsA (DUF1100 family)